MPLLAWCVAGVLVQTGVGMGAGPAGQTTTEVLLVEGDSLQAERYGHITRIDQIAVNDHGQWLAVVETDVSDPLRNSFLLYNAPALILRESQRVDAPSGAAINAFGEIAIDNSGLGFWDIDLDANFLAPVDRGVYVFRTALVLLEGDDADAPGLPVPTTYGEPIVAGVNDADEVLLLTGLDLGDDGVPERGIIVLDYDHTDGSVTQRVVAKTGDLLPGQTQPVDRFFSANSASINDAGDVIYFVDLVGPTDADQCVYLNDTLLAQEGQPAPVPGRKYAFADGLLGSQAADINDAGGYVFRARLDGSATDEAIVANGQVVARVGVPLEDTAPFVVTSFATGTPVAIGDNGAVFFQGVFNTPETSRNEAIFLNGRFVLREGDLLPGGQRLLRLRSGANAFRVSDDGRTLLASVILEGNLDAIVRVTIDEACDCDWNTDSALNDQDFFDFVNDLFGQSGPTGNGDFNLDGFTNEQDFFDFANCFFTRPLGCSIGG